MTSVREKAKSDPIRRELRAKHRQARREYLETQERLRGMEWYFVRSLDASEGDRSESTFEVQRLDDSGRATSFIRVQHLDEHVTLDGRLVPRAVLAYGRRVRVGGEFVDSMGRPINPITREPI